MLSKLILVTNVLPFSKERLLRCRENFGWCFYEFKISIFHCPTEKLAPPGSSDEYEGATGIVAIWRAIPWVTPGYIAKFSRGIGAEAKRDLAIWVIGDLFAGDPAPFVELFEREEAHRFPFLAFRLGAEEPTARTSTNCPV